MKIVYSARFLRSFKKMNAELVDKVVQKVVLFQQDIYHPMLRTHKLNGKMKEQWSFSVNHDLRIIFELDNEAAIFLDIGNHDIYK